MRVWARPLLVVHLSCAMALKWVAQTNAPIVTRTGVGIFQLQKILRIFG